MYDVRSGKGVERYIYSGKGQRSGKIDSGKKNDFRHFTLRLKHKAFTIILTMYRVGIFHVVELGRSSAGVGGLATFVYLTSNSHY